MSFEKVQADLAVRIIARFLQMGLPSPRHPLVVLIRDGSILDEMETHSLIRAENNRTEYFPTLGTFALLDDSDEKLQYARLGVVRVLYTLINLYETRDCSTTYSREELIGHVRDRYDSVDPDQISLGLYLAASEFRALRSFGRSEDGTQIRSFTIAEEVLKIADPESSLQSQSEAVGINDSSDEGEIQYPEEVQSTAKHPKVFVSYAWEGEEHQDWVRKFATRLRHDGVDVSLDQWDLEPGDNRLQFMEKVASVDSVVIVCTPLYAEKSNARQAGVGYESNIITSGIAEKTGRQKYIPVLRSGGWASSVPVWLKHAIGADLTGDLYSDTEYRKLLRTLHRKRVSTPKLGPFLPSKTNQGRRPR